MNKIINTIKRSKLLIAVVFFVIGGVLTMMFLPEKIRIEEKEKVIYRDKIVEVEVIKWKDKIVEKIIEVSKKTYKKTVIIKLPDGTYKEEIIEYSSTEELARLEESLKERYQSELKEKEKQWEEEKSKLTEITNQKRIKTYVGINVVKWTDKEYLGGFQYKVWGPVNVGAEVTTKGNLFPVVGLEF
jgi:hypothetical protein